MAAAKTDDKKKKKKLSYAQKHDFAKVGISDLHNVLKLAIKNLKPVMIVGAAGIGKTDIIGQVAKELDMGFIPIHLSQYVPEDINGVPVPIFEEEIVKFLKNELLPREGRHVILFDELLQAERQTITPIFQLLTDRRINNYELPEGCALIAATNPDGLNYQTTKPTPALRRRMIWVETEFEVTNWIQWAKNSGIHPAVIEFIERNPKDALNQEALANDKVFANPAGWETVSDLIHGLGSDDSADDLTPLIAGTVGMAISKKFMSFLSKYEEHVDPTLLLKDYSKVKPAVLGFKKKGRTDALVSLSNAVCYKCLDIDPDKKRTFKKALDNLVEFFVDLPNDVCMAFGKTMQEVFTDAGKGEEHEKWAVKFTEHPVVADKLMEMMSVVDEVEKDLSA